MRTLGLPGRNPGTGAWIRELFHALSLEDAEVARYRHWDEAIEPDVEREAASLHGQCPDLLVAKSLGTLIATTAHASFSFRPRRAVVIGVPLRRLTSDMLDGYRRFANQLPSLFIQQTADFNGPFSELHVAIGETAYGRFAEVPGHDHFYGNIAELVSVIEPWAHTDAA